MSVPSIPPTGSVQSAIALASRKTGIDFNYLLGQAQVESGLRPHARAGTSSATGLYQFIEQSWLAVVKQHGAEHGLGWAADSISEAGGRLTVADGATRQAILGLRNDPTIASLMAAEHASDNKTALEGVLGRPATGTDLYMAHFLGLGGARNFLATMASDPDRGAASLFPAAARANRGVFYTADGHQRSMADIYQRFAAKLDRGAAAVGGTGRASDSVGDGFAAQVRALGLGGDSTVITGNGVAADDAVQWAAATLDRLNGKTQLADANLLRPTPRTARLAYMMLASMGG
ncbi:lytic transglycosylase domain-containing protein [Hephaestia sp. GCM10023244]|uniref:lytic transglycosylase domain-containing protein n=1 Tax=unclassified Hephaestia TaxID=2631281 RepID=UPI002077651B|nr:lytic transglycosylase domain-containing protein [Hephaestia sp. MAHUQ-44]MCM8731253.1 lytic transglycosylase domain-containing protein [Hephaestia sp. MAHUQ-44]